MSDEDKCDHPACELVITSMTIKREMTQMWLTPDRSITIPGKTHYFVDVKCAMCGEIVQLTGDIDDKA